VIHNYIFKGKESNNQDGEEQKPTFLKTIDKVKDSGPVKIVKEISSVAGEHLGKFGKDFASALKAEEEKQKNVDGKNQEWTLNI